MASSNGSVTLAFVADTKSFDRGVKNVATGSDNLSRSVVKSERGVKHLADSLENATTHGRASADVMDGLSTAIGGSAGEALLLTRGLSDVTDGMSILIPKLKEGVSGLGLLRGGLLAGAAALATFGLSQEGSLTKASTYKKGLVDLNYAVAHNINLVGQHIPLLGRLTGAYEDNANATSLAVHNADTLSAAESRLMAQLINTGNAAAYSNAQVAAARAKQSAYGPYKTGYQFDTNNPGYQELSYEAFMNPKVADSVRTGAGSVAKAVGDGIDKIKQAAMDKLAKYQSVADEARNAAKAITDALKPVLNPDFGASNLLVLKGPSGILAGLQDQLTKTKHLAADIASLAKAGLSKDLLSQLVSGGLDSIPAADQLLAGGKSSVKQANNLSSEINSTAAGIASAEVLRNAAKPNTVTIKFDPTGATTDDLLKLLRKAIRVDAGGDVQLALGSKKK